MKTMLAYPPDAKVGDAPIEVVIHRVIRLRFSSPCSCVRAKDMPEFDAGLTIDGAVYLREAGAPDDEPWSSGAIADMCTLDVVTAFRPVEGEPNLARVRYDNGARQRQARAAIADYEQRRKDGLVDGYEPDKPRDQVAERKKKWRPGEPVWKQQDMLDGESEDS